MEQTGSKNWGAWVVVGLVVLLSIGGLTWLVMTNKKAPLPTGVVGPISSQILASDHVLGNPNASTTLIEYGDFQCPACAVYDPLVQQLHKDFPTQLAIVYRNFPLTQIHANAQLSAQAAEAAALQGKYWQMHTLLFAHQTDWENASNASEIFSGYAQQLGLDKTTFASDINSAGVAQKVAADSQSGDNARLEGTPSFFLNGSFIQNPSGYDAFKALIQSALPK